MEILNGDILGIEYGRVGFQMDENTANNSVVVGGNATLTGLGGGVTDAGVTSEQNAFLINAQGAEEALFTRVYFTVLGDAI